MSGILGVVHLDGAPVDPALVRRLTEELRRRGPDADAVWTEGQVGLGNTLLRTSFESKLENQPATLDGEVWITADARIDGRAELVRKLVASGTVDRDAAGELQTATDDMLLLHAYRAWSARCVEHLIGDFAFAIWDGRRRRLFCARDQLGVKPLFYAIARDRLVLASDVACVRGHPDVQSDLNDLAVADFLLWGFNQEPDTTVFAAIRRLPAGHTLTWAGGRPRVERYWELSVPAEIRYSRPADYVERFNELLRTAVADRLRTDQIAVFMSGGVDSPSVAAAAISDLGSAERAIDVRAHAVVYESLMPDEERHYAGIAAGALGIPVKFYPGEAQRLFAGFDDPGWRPPEPSPDPFPEFTREMMSAVAADGRVALSGFDGDALCQLWLSSHFRGLLRSLHLKRALSDATWLTLAQRTLPPVGLRARLRRRKELRRFPPGFPPWMNRELVEELDLRVRWQRFAAPQRPLGRPVRADAVELLTAPGLHELFDSYDPAYTGAPLVVRHPLLDLRIVDYALALPPIPWCVDKTILRRAARGKLPAAICQRPKAPLAEDPAQALVRRSEGLPSELPDPSPMLARYVAPEALPPVEATGGPHSLWPRLWVSCLDQWLRRSGPTS